MNRRSSTHVLPGFLLLAVCTCVHSNSASAAQLDAVIVTGSEHYSARDFAGVTSRFVGQSISSGLIAQITKEVESVYRDDGYVVPRIVQLDPTIETSTPRLHVFEAAIASVVVRGDAGPHRDAIESRAQSLRGNLIDKRAARAALAAIEALPGIRAKAHFEPSEGDINRFVLVLEVSYRAVEATASAHNRGTEEIGPVLAGGRVALNGLLGAGEKLAFTAFTAQHVDDYQYFATELERRFGAVDTALQGSTSKAMFADDSEYSTQRADLELRTVAYDSGNATFEPWLALGMRDSDGRAADGDRLSLQRTRWIGVGAATRLTGEYATTRVRADVARGFDALGAMSQTLPPADVELAFTKAMLDVVHVRALTTKWSARLDVEAQWSADDLPFGERFTFGGARFGRGFDPGTLVGDSGASASVQVLRALDVSGQWLRSLQAFVQTDYGYADDVRYGSDTAASGSVGITGRVSIVQATLELSQSLLAPEAFVVDESPRAFFTMRMTF